MGERGGGTEISGHTQIDRLIDKHTVYPLKGGLDKYLQKLENMFLNSKLVWFWQSIFSKYNDICKQTYRYTLIV